ncbi:MAG: adenine phosphoribosyltransferase [Bacteroidetes bacterium]|nr:adenine phosphoribosyltransferase [Bacteroidota bacterium]
MDLQKYIRTIPDFPKQGIMFRDITTLLKDEKAFAETIDIFYHHYKNKNITKVVGIESRGFIIGAALAYRLGCGFVPIRKPNKLPAETIKKEYELEYGTDSIEIHKDAVQPNERILIHDDLLATGGTIAAACSLLQQLKAEIVGLSFIIELSFLNPRKRLGNYEIFSLIQYNAE